MKLRNRVILITGGSRGLGKSMALGCAAEGGEVIITGRSSVQPEWVYQYEQVSYYQQDVGCLESTKKVLERVFNQYAQIDVLVNNAGINRDHLFKDMSLDDWNEVINTNLTGPFICSKAVLPYFIDQGYGKIINISSAAATRVNIGQANYCTAKAGVEMLTKVLAIELPRIGNITVNCIQPGVFEEGMGEELMSREKVWDKYKPRFASGRPGYGNELASSLVFLASDESNYINGHVLEVNGGLMWV
ncbi:3-oxoacyl-[acyl-carrier protein] reductase [Cytobacillus oceanisediminis]|jgi:3-oxoacyl-[acyl-carrier protein] reductase|uniref:3-oxoacyl-[acyl-carrier protein] reductase n=1 Tax=Cytobacillus oceanisediminis TaxID=665099 RepID=A0A2V2ZZ05_9BACI|nr:3-oxoacyl-ACP reductase family protein [Cytobacillus oceanisediminis]PWW28922.1 3-oxoacyl-[acyl-carrier protein] reductase [Cytobacillus oceanisediminis]